ncbi:MAG: hypothetical protein ACFE0O_08060 [Opitutales bacterium]
MFLFRPAFVSLHWKRLCFAIAWGCLLGLAGLFGQRSQDDLPPMPDPALVRELNRADQVAWYEAIELIEEGESDVQTGQWYQQRKPGSLNPNEDMAKVHAIGRRTEEQGREKIRQGREQLARLAEKARSTRQAREGEADRETRYQVELGEVAAFEETLITAADRLLETLHERGTDRIFVHGVYAYTALEPRLQADWAHPLQAAFTQADGTRFSVFFAPEIEVATAENGQSVITFAEKGISRDGEPLSLVLGEVFPEPDGKHGLLVLRAIDLATWNIMTAHWARIALPEATPPAGSATGQSPLLTLSTSIRQAGFTDTSGFVERARASAGLYRFRFDYRPSALEALGNPHAVPSLLKAILVEEAEAPVTDYDFIARLFQTDAHGTRRVLQKGINAAWDLVAEKKESDTTYLLRARQLADTSRVEIGPVTLAPAPVAAEKKGSSSKP